MNIIPVIFDPYLGTILAPHTIGFYFLLPGIQNMAAAFFRREVEFLFDIHRQHFLPAGIPEHLQHGRVDVHKPSLVRTAVDAIHHVVEQGVIAFFRFTQRRLRLFAFGDVAEGNHRAYDLLVFQNRPTAEDDREAGAVFAPEIILR